MNAVINKDSLPAQMNEGATLLQVIQNAAQNPQADIEKMERLMAMHERFQAQLAMAKLPRNSHPTRVRNRCALTGRARGNYRKFGISRLMLRELASQGMIPGVTKSSW